MTAAGKTRWTIILLAVGAGVVTALHIGKAPPALPAIRSELGLGLVAGGWVISVFSAIGAGFALAVGTVADRIGHRRSLIAGLGLAVAGSLGGSVAQGAAALMASRILEGFGFVVVAVAAPSIITAASEGGTRRFALGLWGAYLPAGAALMMLASPLMLDRYGWRPLWQVLGAITLVAAVVVATGIGKSVDRMDPGQGRSTLMENLRLTLRCPGPWLLGIMFAFYTVQFAALMAWLPSFLIEERGFSITVAATLTAIMVAANAPGNLAAGWLLRHGWQHWPLLMAAGTIMGISGLGIFSEALPDTLRYALCIIFSGFGGMLPATALSGVPVFAPSPAQIGTANGMLVQGANLGLFLGPPALGAVVALTGRWESSVALMFAAASITVVLSLMIRGLERKAS